MNISHLIVNVSLNVSFAACFIGLFFFTYAKDLEKKIVVNNVAYIVDDLLANTVALLPAEAKSLLKSQIDSTKLPDMTEADKSVERSNAKLLQQATMVLLILLIVAIIVSHKVAADNNIDFTDAIYHNLVLLACIGVTEYIFLAYIAQYYISADPNVVARAVISMLKDDHKTEHKSGH